MDNPIIVALDVPELDEAAELARRLEGEVGMFKVGLELFGAHGPEAVKRIAKFGPVFLDLKLHDIPTTMGRAATRLGRLGVSMLTVHASAGPEGIRASVEGLAEGSSGSGGPSALVLAVTVLTSMSEQDLATVNQPGAATQVPALAAVAVQSGAPGLVCAPRDIEVVRAAVGDEPVLVTPGIRPVGDGDDDHARSATPKEAIAAGANHLVIGRPITRASDPVAAVRAIAASLGV